MVGLCSRGEHKEGHPVVLLEGEDDVDPQRQRGSSLLQTCFNLINVFMGIGYRPSWFIWSVHPDPAARRRAHRLVKI